MLEAPNWLDADSLAALAARAHAADTDPGWPEESWRLLQTLGGLGWSIRTEFGGQGLDRVAQLEGNEQLGAACLTTAFILSQREAAIRWLLPASETLQQRYLPPLARGEIFVTVGLSQLTTSRQHRPPSLRATALGPPDHPEAYRLDGEIPWVTGADQAGAVVAGAALEDGRQLVLLLPLPRPGAAVEAPVALAALAGSRTAQIRCEAVEVAAELILAGPGPQLVRSGGGLETSNLALGLARAATAFLVEQAGRRPEISEAATRLAGALSTSRQRLHALARSTPAAEEVLAMRVECTRLVLRATQAALTVAKGAGFLADHPVQRWARQAHFFLVWSCPQPVAAALLADLTGE